MKKIQLGGIRKSYLPILLGGFLVMTTLSACGDNNSGLGGTQQSVNGWPEPDSFPAIEFSAEERKKPGSIEEANATLGAIRKLYNTVPYPITGSVSPESAYNFAKILKLLKNQLPEDISWLKSVQGATIPGADKWTAQTFDNPKATLLGSLKRQVPDSIERTLNSSRQNLTGIANSQMDFVRRAADVDLKDESAVRNLLSNELTNRSRDESIKQAGTAIEALILLDETIGGESANLGLRDDFRETVTRYREKLSRAADAIQPPADVGDSELTKIAEQVMRDGDVGLPVPERIIVNTRKRNHSQDYFTVDFGEREITKDPYRWEEFQVATIEKSDGVHFLWYTTLMNYSVGPHTVPVGKWVVGPRHKSAQISEANINN